MDRRELLKGGLAAVAFGVVGLAVHAETEPGGKDTRTVFKLVEHQSITHLRVGSDQWEPTSDEIDNIVQAFVAAEEDGVSSVIGTNKDVQLSTLSPGGIILVKMPFKDLKKGDKFIMYEEDGTLVVDDYEGAWGAQVSVWECQEDAYHNAERRGSTSVFCEPVKTNYTFPETCPA